MTERVILESEVFMTDTKKNTLTILAVVLTIAVIFSACTSIFTAKAVGQHQRIKREGQGDLGTGLRCAERNHHRRYDAL